MGHICQKKVFGFFSLDRLLTCFACFECRIVQEAVDREHVSFFDDLIQLGFAGIIQITHHLFEGLFQCMPFHRCLTVRTDDKKDSHQQYDHGDGVLDQSGFDRGNIARNLFIHRPLEQ